jgi:hypothetical protein
MALDAYWTPPASSKLKLHIQSEYFATFSVEVDSAAPMADVLDQAIAAKVKPGAVWPPSDQELRLFYGGKFLDAERKYDEKTVVDYHLKEGSTLKLLMLAKKPPPPAPSSDVATDSQSPV